MHLNEDLKYFKGSSLEVGKELTFIDAGIKKPFGGKPDGDLVWEFLVSYDGVKKPLTVNKTSRNSLGDMWGKETNGWVGKVAQITKPIMPSPSGEMKERLVLVPTDKKVSTEEASVAEEIKWDE